jgi:hypothetical protein
MALYAFDGTWQQGKAGDDPKYANSNVFRFFNAYSQNSGTGRDLYVKGIGTRWEFLGRIVGGAFGLGALHRLDQAYDKLCENWANGDTDIDIVGFSRGAATALDFSNIIVDRGIRKPGTKEVVDNTPQIRFLGLWDTVGAFGLASLGSVDLNIGHRLRLPKGRVKHCFHGLALDERRLSFLPTRLPGAWEVWFRGAHSDVGGGNQHQPLNDYALKWMMNKAKAATLPITATNIALLKPAQAEPKPAKSLPLPVRAVYSVDRQHYSVTPLPRWTNPPDTCPVETSDEECLAQLVGDKGIEIGAPDVQARIVAIRAAAGEAAIAEGLSIDHALVWLMELIEGRVGLVTDATLPQACANAKVLVQRAALIGKRLHYDMLIDNFLNQALFESPHLFPFTD